ncbi:MAG TPA: phage tail assembly chaperone [Parvibaculum sp.]|jgi:uncharacterized phage protein (TIGR02216 family)
MKAFPWARAMELGLGHLRLAPRDFWRMTLPELAAAARGSGLGSFTQSSMSREQLIALNEDYPDR